MKIDIQNSNKINKSCNKRMVDLFWLNGDGINKFLSMNHVGKQIKKMNTTSENMTYLVDNKTICVNINNWNH